METAELWRYLWQRLKALGLSDKPLAGYYDATSWLYEGRRVAITRIKQRWLGIQLVGRCALPTRKGLTVLLRTM